MKFSARMKYEKADYEAFTRMSGKVLNRWKNIGTRIMLLIIAVFFIVLAATLALQEMNGGMMLCILCIIAAVCFFAISILLYRCQAWLLRHRQGDMGEINYTFREKGFHMESALGESDYNYKFLRLVLESDEYFFLMLSESSALVLPKRSMVVGTARGLKEFLEEKTGKPIQTVEL